MIKATYTDNAFIQQEAARTIANVAIYHAAALVQKGTIQPLIFLLCAEDSMVKSAVACALANIAAADVSLGRLLAHAGAIKAAVPLLRNCIDDGTTCACHAARLLSLLPHDAHNLERMVAAGAIEPLVALLASDDDYAAGYAAWCLGELLLICMLLA